MPQPNDGYKRNEIADLGAAREAKNIKSQYQNIEQFILEQYQDFRKHPRPDTEYFVGNFRQSWNQPIASDVSQADDLSMSDQISREELDARLKQQSAETDTKFARLDGKMDLVLSKFDGQREDNRATRANQWVIGFGLAGLIVAAAALLPVFFGVGTSIRDMVHSEVSQQMPVSQHVNTPKTP